MALSEPFPVFDDSEKDQENRGFLPKSFPGFVDLGNDLGDVTITSGEITIGAGDEGLICHGHLEISAINLKQPKNKTKIGKTNNKISFHFLINIPPLQNSRFLC